MEENISFTKYCCSIGVLLLALLCNNITHAQNTDIDWLRSINSHRTASRDGIMIGVTNSAYVVSSALPLAQLIYGYAKNEKKSIRDGLQTIEGLAVNTILTFGLKYAVDRPRPYATYTGLNPYLHDTDPSFPSGHTSFAFSTATTLSLEYGKWYVVVPAYLWAGTVGFSRMYLGMHYPSDVLAGAVVGAGSSWLSYKAQSWLDKRFNKKEKQHSPVSN